MENSPKKWWGNRKVYEFDVPAKYVDLIGGKKIGMVQLTANDEIQASEMADGNRAKLAYINLRFSIATLDNRVIGRDSEEIEAMINKDAAFRSLLLMAQSQLTIPNEKDSTSFLSSMTIREI